MCGIEHTPSFNLGYTVHLFNLSTLGGVRMLGLKVVYKAGYHKGKVFEVLSYPFMDPTFGIPVVVI